MLQKVNSKEHKRSSIFENIFFYPSCCLVVKSELQVKSIPEFRLLSGSISRTPRNLFRNLKKARTIVPHLSRMKTASCTSGGTVACRS